MAATSRKRRSRNDIILELEKKITGLRVRMIPLPKRSGRHAKLQQLVERLRFEQLQEENAADKRIARQKADA